MSRWTIVALAILAVVASQTEAACNPDLDCTCSNYCNSNYNTKVGYCTAYDSSSGNLSCRCVTCASRSGKAAWNDIIMSTA